MTLVRPVEGRDAEAWAAMRADLWPQADREELVHETQAFVEGSRATILAAAFIAANERGTPLGFIEVALRAFSDGCDSMPVPHVEGWYVEPGTRGLGVGRQLMDAAQAWARALGFSEIASDTEIDNVASLHAHEACGFQEVERLIKLRKALD